MKCFYNVQPTVPSEGHDHMDQVVGFGRWIGYGGITVKPPIVWGNFTKILESHDVAVFRDSSSDIGQPYFDLYNVHIGGDNRQLGKAFFVIIAKILGDEEVLIIFIFICPDREFGCLRIPLDGYVLRLALLL